MESIAQVQDKEEQDILKPSREIQKPRDGLDAESKEAAAAKTLQRTYRGHRARRELRGLSLDPTSRWIEVCTLKSCYLALRKFPNIHSKAVKEVQYRNLTTPRPHSSRSPSDGPKCTTSGAYQQWSRIGKIARRAGGDEESSLSSSSDNDAVTPSQKEARRRRRLAEKQERTKSAKQMDISYFLEMVDVKHRYGSNLRKYHAEWKKSSTKENFFYWLDQGEGKNVELENCSRERLENMQVRYLGREERRLYEVVVDKEGKLCWRKDGVRVDTTDKWRDSVKGIVRVGDPAPDWARRPVAMRGSSESSGMDSEGDNNMSLPTSPVEERKEPMPSIESVKEGQTPQSPKPRHSLSFWKSGDGKEKKEKKKKQLWIFVRTAREQY